MMKRLMTTGGLFVLLTAFVTSCTAPRTQPIPEITFAHLSPIGLKVRTVEVASEYTSSDTPPHVERKFRVTPDAVLQRWAYDRLRATGTQGLARFTVVNAPVTTEPLPKKTGFLGAFSVEPDTRYTITVEAKLEIYDDSGTRVGVTSARVTNSRTLEEGSTPAEQQYFYYELTAATMNEFNNQMDPAIHRNLGEWLQ